MDMKSFYSWLIAFSNICLVFGDFYAEDECNNALLDRAVVTATSSMPERGPENINIYGSNAWTAKDNDFDQQLIIDLGQIMNVTGIVTRGRPFANEYVMEFSISYGTNGLDYADYKEPGRLAWSPTDNTMYNFLTWDLGGRFEINSIETKGLAGSGEFVTEYMVQYSDDGEGWKIFTDAQGNAEVFRGNTDDDSFNQNSFEIPIIAQWIRINPIRWRNRISMRVELFGCEYDADDMYFNGTALLMLDLLRDPISASRENIRFRFKTSAANGILLYSRGTQGDYIALQMRDNQLLLNIDLGSSQVTSLSIGSLLDDNIWHDVVVSRNRRDILLSVDRVFVQDKIKGEFNRLNLNREFYIGGVPNIQEGLVVVQNFTGCLENLYLNSTNLFKNVKEAYENGEVFRYEKVNILYSCPEPPIVPVTFLTQRSFAKLSGYEGMKSLNVSFAFRTYERTGLILYHSFSSSGYIAIFLEDGKLKVELVTRESPRVIFDNYEETYNDGKWHTLVLTITTNSMVLNLDNRPMRTTRLMSIRTGSLYFIAGGVTATIGASGRHMAGFVGCMRTIGIDGSYKLPTDWRNDEFCCDGEVAFDACRMIDRCSPNPCQHGGICKQNEFEFFCDCAGTGYGGAVCHTSINALSCEAHKKMQAVGQRADIKIDVDGSGPLAPFPVTCEFYPNGHVATVLRHNNHDTTPVDGFQEPGSFVQDIHYEASDDQINALVNRSSTCRQHIQYACKGARLFNSPSDEMNFNPYSWWVSRHNQNMDYWGGSLPNSRKCECGILGSCVDKTKWCNCDAGLDTWQVDAGDIVDKENLPVKQLRFGDTGNALDEKEGRYTLGPLICEGDDLFNNVVTFRVDEATINLPTFDMGHGGDIYFEFRTASENAVLFHSKGPHDYIKLSIVSGNRIQFQYQAGSGPVAVVREVSYKLSNDEWHSVLVERNRKESMLVVDGALKAEVREPPGPFRPLHLTSALVIGANTEYRDGFTGCIRALLINGEHIDLRSYARRGAFGISEGCVGKCESSPCLNNGTCFEHYDHYTCDCRWTAFKGPICADEIGVNMKPSSMIKYDFMGSWRSTIAEHIRVGFTTTNPRGFLLGFSSNISKEYMTIMVSNSGHLRVVFDFGFERQEIIYPEKHFGLGQYHDLRLSRKNSGSTLVMQVDNYKPREFNFSIKASADAQFNNIQYMYIGRNESITEGFVGCISRVEFDDIYPLKLLFQQEGPGNVKSLGSALTEDYCGVEPITHPPDLLSTRPPPQLDEDKLRKAYNQTDSAILGGILAILFVALIILLIIIGRFIHRHKGEYLTQEDAGAESALDPDTAVVCGTTGHHVQKRKEWFI